MVKSISHIFRAYDIRGIYGKDLNEKIMERIGNVFSIFVDSIAVVGYDNRNSSISLRDAFINGLTRSGKNVIDVGLVPKPVAVFAGLVKQKPVAYITASHLPPEYNGVKFSYSNGLGFSEKDNMKIKEIFMSNREFIFEKGNVRRYNPIEYYKQHLIEKIPYPERKMKVLLDCGNGTAGIIVKDIFERKGYNVDILFGEPDGNFPNRESEISEKALKKVKELSMDYDVAIAYDGDCDRMGLIYKGRLLTPEQMAYVILKELLKTKKGAVVTNVECSRIIDKIVSDNGCEVIRVPVGFTFMVHALHEKNGIYGIERSLHSCIPEIMPFDDAIAISLYTAYVASKIDIEETLKEIPETYMERVDFNVSEEKKFVIIENLKKKLMEKYELNTMDGIRIDFPDSWVLIRASNTSPIIRLTMEANSEKRLQELKNEFINLLEKELK